MHDVGCVLNCYDEPQKFQKYVLKRVSKILSTVWSNQYRLVKLVPFGQNNTVWSKIMHGL